MSVDFFDNPCACSTQKERFGLCDDVAAVDCPTNPAYIDENNEDDWTADVTNEKQRVVTFYPIDNCIDIRRDNGDMDNRCDGMLINNDELLFVELKDRDSHKWIAKGREQLEVTIGNFKKAHDIGGYKRVAAYLCNKQRPRVVVSCPNELQKFYDNTGYQLIVDRNIKIFGN